MKSLTTLSLALFVASFAHAGYEQPSYIDGCRSADGRFEITAKLLEAGKSSHGPNKWQYVWKDNKDGIVKEFPAQGIQGGQNRGQLFIAPDGETFAFWNHITMFWPGKSHMHAHDHDEVIKRGEQVTEEFRNQFIFSKRLVIYKKDGSIIKSMDMKDFLEDGDWKFVLPVFTRCEWIRPYSGINHKNAKRAAYCFTKVSPDYTVIEFQVGDPKSPRAVRVSLTDGAILTGDLPEERTPVLVVDAAEHPKSGQPWTESYVPSLDPVRKSGSYRIDTIEEAFPPEKAPKKQGEFETGPVEKLADGFIKADTPSWLKRRGKAPDEAARLIFCDLGDESTPGKLYTLFPGEEVTEIRAGATRGRIVGGRTFYGLVDGKICSWDPYGKDEPKVILAEGHKGNPVSLNDMVVSARGLIYFTTLKDPEKGRLSVLDPASGEVTVLFDGEDIPELANPNGIALDKNERFLYVGISNYKNRKHSGVYAFPIRGDGTIDVEAGKAKPRIPIKAPDGIAVDRQGNIYFTAGNTVHVYDPYVRPLGKINIPKGSGTNLAFGGEDRFAKTLFITTREALYAVETPYGGQ